MYVRLVGCFLQSFVKGGEDSARGYPVLLVSGLVDIVTGKDGDSRDIIRE